MLSRGAAVSKMDELTAAAAALRAAVAAARAALLLALLLRWLLALCAYFLMAQALQTVQRLPLGLVSKEERGSTLRHSVQTCSFWQAPSLHLLSPEQACVGPPQWGVQKEGAKERVTCAARALESSRGAGGAELTAAGACEGGGWRKERGVTQCCKSRAAR